MALYSLLCRNTKCSLLPNYQAADEELFAYHNLGYSNRNIPSSPIKRFIDKHKKAKTSLLLVALFGACMVISIGVLTPAISGKHPFFLLIFLLEFSTGTFTGWVCNHYMVSYLLLDTCANRYLVLAVLSSVEGLKVRVTDMNNSEYWLSEKKEIIHTPTRVNVCIDFQYASIFSMNFET